MAQENIKKKRLTPSKISSHSLMGILTLAAFILIICSSDVAIEYMKKGLGLCAGAVIPSLFPFMIISELIVSSGIGIRISRLLARPTRWLFGVSEAGAAAFFLGIVCGFPIGARTAVLTYDKGGISKRELERILTFCNNPGSAFVTSAVGVSLFGNRRLGWLLYACVIISSVIVGTFGKFFSGKSEDIGVPLAASEHKDVIKSVTDAIQSSALSMLSVCAYVVFFSAFIGCIGAYLSRFSPPDELIATIFGFFELSSGVGAAKTVNNPLNASLLSALFLGWSGLSVHFQVMSVCSGRGISFKPYVIAKAAQGVICASLAALSLKFIFPSFVRDSGTAFLPFENTAWRFGSIVCVVFFGASLLCVGVSFLVRRKFLKINKEKIEKRY